MFFKNIEQKSIRIMWNFPGLCTPRGFMCCMIGINYKTHIYVHKPVFYSVIFSKNSNLFIGFTLRFKTQCNMVLM